MGRDDSFTDLPGGREEERERGKGFGKKENGRRRGSTTVLIGGASMAAAAAEGRSINVASAAHAQVKHARERAAPARP